MSRTKVDVRIFGQNYTITGDSDPEQIAQIADYVDGKIRFIDKVTSELTQVRIAILSAINITEEYFGALAKIKELEDEKKDLEQEVQSCMRKVEEKEQDFMSYQKDVLKAKDERKDSDERYEELERKFSEVENAYFDLQMENMKLKSQVKKLEIGKRE